MQYGDNIWDVLKPENDNNVKGNVINDLTPHCFPLPVQTLFSLMSRVVNVMYNFVICFFLLLLGYE